MHHLVMRQRQHEVLAEGVHQAEGHLVVVPAPVQRVFLHVAQGVVHPAHVPLEVEAQAAGIRGRGHAREGRGLLGHGEAAGALHTHHLVHALEQGNGLQVLAPAVYVGHPLTVVARVVAVEHGGHRVHAQAVHTLALQPVQRAAHQEVAHLVAAEVVDEGVPVVVEAFARVGVLVQRRAVELRQAVRVGGKVRRHPVHQHAQAPRVAGLHEARKSFRRPETRTGRIQAQGLVTPGTIERMLGDGQQLHMREAQVSRIGRQHVGQLIPGHEAPLRSTPPGADMHLVDGDGCVPVVGGGAGFGQAARLRQCLGHHAGGVRTHLGGAGVGVALQRQQAPVAAVNLVLVVVTRRCVGDEGLPHARRAPAAHRMPPSVPGVEVTHHAHLRSVGGPDREANPGHRLRAFAQAHGVGPQHLERPQVRALAEVVQVLVADQRGHHTRSMYWPMVRSTLKGPMPAILRSARSAHAGRLANSASTSSWVRT